MAKEPENFDALRKLLSLKGHEQPPPGFFQQLPGQVLDRIAEAEARKDGWWSRLFESFELRPALSMAYGGALCGLLLAGIYFGKQAGGQNDPGLAGVESPANVMNPFNVNTGELTRPPVGIFDPVTTVPVMRAGFETNPPVQRP